MSRWWLVGAVVVMPACAGSPQVTAPSRTPAPLPSGPPPAPAGLWTVTIATTGNTGPDLCIFTPAVGVAGQTEYGLSVGGETVSFDPIDPFDWDTFTVTLSGLNFVGSNPPVTSGKGTLCTYTQASTLSGTFSADMMSFTATETWAFTFGSNQMKTITFAWSGTRQERPTNLDRALSPAATGTAP